MTRERSFGNWLSVDRVVICLLVTVKTRWRVRVRACIIYLELVFVFPNENVDCQRLDVLIRRQYRKSRIFFPNTRQYVFVRVCIPDMSGL